LLAAEGRHNKEIAAALFLTVGTVERHLTSVYRKLNLRSRAELAGRFSRARDDVSQ
jgi:DNA-binding NarL/FixJ family response regulator